MPDFVELIGLCAAVLTTVAFAPQVVKTWRMGGHELSWLMLAMFGSGVTLWLVYGWLRDSTPLMLGNGITLILVAVMTGVKFRARRERPSDASGPSRSV